MQPFSDSLHCIPTVPALVSLLCSSVSPSSQCALCVEIFVGDSLLPSAIILLSVCITTNQHVVFLLDSKGLKTVLLNLTP